MKTNHRATQPIGEKYDTIPEEISKIAVFNAFARDNFSATEYYRYISSRPEPFYQALKQRNTIEQLEITSQQFGFKLM